MWILLLVDLALAGAYEDGLEALRAGRHAEARASLQQAVDANPDNAEAWWELGWSHWALEDYEATVRAWERTQALGSTRDDLAPWLDAARLRARLSSPVPVQAEVPLEPEGDAFTMAAAGDTMMGSDLRKGPAGLAPGAGEDIFVDAAPVLDRVDVAFLNLEGPLADDLPSTKCGPQSTACYAFRTPTRYAAALTGAGVDVVSLANNHAMDLGSAGMASTMATLDAAGIAHAGRYGDEAHLEVGEVTVALLAAHSGSCCLNVNRIDEVVQAIALADEWSDVVVLSFHGGAEGPTARHVPGEVEIAWGERRGDVRALARAAVDAGADLVLGHGPHVLRAMEVYRGRLIAYSLGNFVGYRQFGTRGGYGGTSAVLEVELAANGVLLSAHLHPFLLDSTGRPRTDPTGQAWQQVRELSAADLPDTGVEIHEDGQIGWIGSAPGGYQGSD